jgi:hypothetical protein
VVDDTSHTRIKLSRQHQPLVGKADRTNHLQGSSKYITNWLSMMARYRVYRPTCHNALCTPAFMCFTTACQQQTLPAVF